MALEIVKYGDPVLREKAMPVPIVTDEVRRLAKDMLVAMRRARGVGLAAQQVGRTEALCVIDVPADCEDDDATRDFNAAVPMPLVMVNPVILSLSGEAPGKEGCLSFPGVGGEVTRAERVTCQYADLDGRVQIVSAGGFLARAIQHETDHLDGVLYVDRMTEEARAQVAKKLRKFLG